MARAAGDGGRGLATRRRIPSRTRSAIAGMLRHAAVAQMQPGGDVGGGGAGGAPGGQPAVDPYNFDADPVYQRVIAANQRRVQEAQANSLAARKQLAIDSGDESLAPDEATRQAARNNPFSLAAQFAKHAREQPRALTEQDNANNLFYSSAAGQHQSELAQQLLAEQAGNQAQTRGRLSDIESALRGEQQGAESDLLDAQQAAADRRQQQLGDLPVGQTQPAHGGGAPGAQQQAVTHSAFARARRQMAQRARAPRPRAHLPGRRH